MEYTIIVNGQSYDLPKKTIAVMDELDLVLKVDATNLTTRQKFAKLHNFIKNLVGENAAKEMFGSDNIEDIDLSDVTIAVKKVVDAYDRPIRDYDVEKTTRAFDSIPIDKLISMTKAAEKIGAMPKGK